MEVVSEGNLESISRPPSSNKRSSSRSSVRSLSKLQGSLDILSPEDPSEWAKPEIEEDVIVIDFTDDLNHLNPDADQILSADAMALPFTSEFPDNEKLLGQNEERRKEIESTEAPDICSEKETMNKEPNPQLESDTSSVGDNHDLDNIDPKICKGLEKIKKLDAILSEKIKEEKEVKKQRREQERIWREQIENLERTRHAELGKQVDLGPAHMLALGAAEDTDGSLYEESPAVTPLFATQPIVDDVVRERRYLQEKNHTTEGQEAQVKDRVVKGHRPNSKETSSESSKEKERNEHQRVDERQSKKDKKGKKKDFIKRNIKLAADANNVIAMTDEEKKRLDELLSDMSNLVDESFAKETTSLTLCGDCFQSSQEEAKQLADIDFQLQSLLPSEDYNAICNSTVCVGDTLSQVRSPRSETSNHLLEDENQSTSYGELVLQETKELREMKQRLFAIEDQLKRFQDSDHNEGVLSESLLRQLLDGSSRTTSQATTILDRISSMSTSMSCETTSSFDNTSFTMESFSPLIPTLER